MPAYFNIKKFVEKKIEEAVVDGGGNSGGSGTGFAKFTTLSALPATVEIDTVVYVEDVDLFYVYNSTGWEPVGEKEFATKEEIQVLDGGSF